MQRSFDILGVTLDATTDEIKRAYRKKVKLYHPDISVLPDAHARFLELTASYEYLLRLKAHPIQKPDPVYNERWEQYEKKKTEDRARYYANMKYREFMKTKYYKATMAAYTVYLYLSLGLGVSIIVGSIYGVMRDYNDPRTDASRYIADFIVFIMGLVFLIFSFYQMSEKKIF